jgi:hypothetical protein
VTEASPRTHIAADRISIFISLIASAFGSSTPDFTICHATYPMIEAASRDFFPGFGSYLEW